MQRLVGSRSVLVLLLTWAAYWAALPWLDCWRGLPLSLERSFSLMRACAVGTEIQTLGPHPLYPNILVALVYIFAAAWVARTALVR
jgi:hypothetical protein